MKKVFFGLLVAAIAVGGSAFTSAQKKVVTNWYAPISSTLLATDPSAQSFSSYNSTPLAEEPTCDQSRYVCAAKFPNIASAPTDIVYKD